MNEQPKLSISFLVRMWATESYGEESEWSGKVQHLISGQARPFRSWLELQAAMTEMLQAENEAARVTRREEP